MKAIERSIRKSSVTKYIYTWQSNQSATMDIEHRELHGKEMCVDGKAKRVMLEMMSQILC